MNDKQDFYSLHHQNHTEKLWEVLTTLLKSNEPNIVQELATYDKQVLECGKAEIEYEIAKGWIDVTILAGLGAAVGGSMSPWQNAQMVI